MSVSRVPMYLHLLPVARLLLLHLVIGFRVELLGIHFLNTRTKEKRKYLKNLYFCQLGHVLPKGTLSSSDVNFVHDLQEFRMYRSLM